MLICCFATMLLWITRILAAFPIKLKDSYGVISNQMYTKYGLTMGKPMMFDKNLLSLKLAPISTESLRYQLFSIHEASIGGLVLKIKHPTSNMKLRTSKRDDTLILKDDILNEFNLSSGLENEGVNPNLKAEEKIDLVYSGSDFGKTFRLISNGKCLEAIKTKYDPEEKIYVKFTTCNDLKSQIWGSISQNQVHDKLNSPHNKDEQEDEQLINRLDHIDESRRSSIKY